MLLKVFFLVLVLPTLVEARSAHYYREQGSDRHHSTARRIISLAPVVTETLFALGEEEHIVGVTRFCDRPTKALALPKVGGLVDPQLEVILSLKPDLVISMPSESTRGMLDILRQKNILDFCRKYLAFSF